MNESKLVGPSALADAMNGKKGTFVALVFRTEDKRLLAVHSKPNETWNQLIDRWDVERDRVFGVYFHSNVPEQGQWVYSMQPPARPEWKIGPKIDFDFLGLVKG